MSFCFFNFWWTNALHVNDIGRFFSVTVTKWSAPCTRLYVSVHACVWVCTHVWCVCACACDVERVCLAEWDRKEERGEKRRGKKSELVHFLSFCKAWYRVGGLGRLGSRGSRPFLAGSTIALCEHSSSQKTLEIFCSSYLSLSLSLSFCLFI